jgi:hypothetical protein
MKTLRSIVLLVALGLSSVSSGEAQQLQYWGREGGAPTGWIELGHERYYEVEPGTDISAWGRVKEVHDDRIVVEQVRTEAEKRELHEQGALVYDVLEIHILREDLRRFPSGGSAKQRR